MAQPAQSLASAGEARPVGGSFRDPSGFVFRDRGRLLRHVAQPYAADYDHLMSSGLYQALTREGLLVEHEEVPVDASPVSGAYRVLAPRELEVWTYPYEWSFSQHKAAALCTLRIAEVALDHKMSLKDASAYNVQFDQGRPVLIDTLSFERRTEQRPWVAYRQFCEHFLVPLALMAKVDVRLGLLFQQFVEGIPLDLGSQLLPFGTRFSPGLQMHLHLHAKAQRRHQGGGKAPARTVTFGENAFRGMLQSLRSTMESLRWTPADTEWGDYYTFTNYSEDAAQRKRALVKDFLSEGLSGRSRPSMLDLGGNTGVYSRLGLELGARVVSTDVDPAAIEKNYTTAQGLKDYHVARLDLTRPSPGVGWALEERDDVFKRLGCDLVMALALVHHVCISNNVPLERFFAALARFAPAAVVEFVPKRDSQVQKLLASREDVFNAYTEEGFEAAAASIFQIARRQRIEGTERTLYLLRRKD